jgi:deoxyribonuclease V
MALSYHKLHDWRLEPAEAIRLQRELSTLVREEPLAPDSIRLAAGSDMSFAAHQNDPDGPVYAGFVTLELPGFAVRERAGVRTHATFPYIPGLLSFREAPPLLEAWEKLIVRPDVLLADGQGRAHPRRFGLACHLGLLLDVPTIGVAKTRFIGTHEPLSEEAGSWTPLLDRDEVIGAVVRTRAGVSPVYVSVGHRVDLPSAIAIVLRCTARTRLPETSRLAHNYVNELRKSDDEIS